jgi:hypothetical protein
MPKRPRRNIAEYRKDVNEARVRRKMKEVENAKRLKENGEPHMTFCQDMLMQQNTKCDSLCGMTCDVQYTQCNVEHTSRGVEFTSYDVDFKLDGVNNTPSGLKAGDLEYTSDNTDCLIRDGVQTSGTAMCAIIIDEDTMVDKNA